MFVKRDGAATVEDVVERNTNISAQDFLKDVRKPYIKNLHETVAYVKEYLLEHPGCRVTIVGDYDSDGINATAIMYWCFQKYGITPTLRLPRRMTEGYGINEKIIDEIPSGLLITVDNGIAALAALKKAKEKGLAVVVLDHHLPVKDEYGDQILPEADMLVDPHLTEAEDVFSDYCGAAIAYWFACEMFNANFPELLVLASIATVTDVMPLIGANRTLVRDGLYYINRRRVAPGLMELLNRLQAEDHISEEDYGFLIGPVYNAAGRIYDNGADRVVQLLCSKRDDDMSGHIAQALIETNNKRKAIVSDSMEKIICRLAQERDPGYPIVIYDGTIPEGIVGIIAGQLTESFHCPAIVFTDSNKEGVLKGSGRSIPGIHLKHILDHIQDTMVGYGGHAGAAGLSIAKEKFDVFRQAFYSACGKIPEPPKDTFYDLDIDLDNADQVIEALKRYAPYGEGNPKIKLRLVVDISSCEVRRIGAGNHIMIKTEKVTLIGFNMSEKYERLGSPLKLDCVGYLTRSWFHGKSSLRFELADLAPME